jgi:branched-chain amino acid transport system permease protein
MNMAHASFYTLGAYLCIGLYAILHLNFFLSTFITVIVMAAGGYLIYWFLSGRTMAITIGGKPVGALLSTRALSYIIVAALALGFASVTEPAKTLISGAWQIADTSIAFDRLAFAGISIVLIAALFSFINYTKVGKSIKAIMQDREAAVMMGINSQRTAAIAFIIGTILAAVGGFLMAPIQLADPATANALQFKVMMVVIIGGIGSMNGTIAAAFLLGFVEAITAAYWGAGWATVVVLALAITIFAARPKGLFGYKYSTP